MRYLQYSEPDIDGKQKIVRVSVQEAIRSAKATAIYVGYFYENDEEALQDFIAVNWASYTDAYLNEESS